MLKELKVTYLVEGACMLLLEDSQAAVARGADVLAEISGYGKSCSNSYFDASQIEEKSGAMALAIDRALKDAGISSGDVDLFAEPAMAVQFAH